MHVDHRTRMRALLDSLTSPRAALAPLDGEVPRDVASLSERNWRPKYTPDDGDLVELFYVPALECAVHYDRSTGYFGAAALALAMRGIEGLIRNNGQMRLVVGCTLDEIGPPCDDRPGFFEQHADGLELWSPGSPLFPDTDATEDTESSGGASIAELLQRHAPIDQARRAGATSEPTS
jgi:hypothetical protein